MGTLVFQANLGGAVNLNGPNIASTVNFTLPSADGTNGQAMVTNGSGTLSFATISTAAATPTVLGTVYGKMTASGASPYLTAAGYNAGTNTTGIHNTVVGYNVLNTNTTGTYNTGVGSQALASATGSRNTAVGATVMRVTTGSENVGIGTEDGSSGYSPLWSNTSGSYNIAVGNGALGKNTTTSNNTAVGHQSLYNNTANENTAVGSIALYSNTTGNLQVAVGREALYSNTTGVENTAVGWNALYGNTTGGYNVAMGMRALKANTTGSNNTAVGYQALFTNSTSSNSTCVGYQAGYSSNSADNIDAFGVGALYSNTTGQQNAAFGQQSLVSNTTGSYNVAVGKRSLNSNTTASYNTSVGHQAGYSINTGAGNVCMGYTAGYNLTTGSYGVYIGIGTQPSAGGNISEIVIGSGAGGGNITGKGTTTGYINPQGGGVYQGNNSTLWSVTSDQRLKKNIVDNNDGLEKLIQVKIRNYEYRLPEEVDSELKPSDAIQKSGVQVGVIAQELQQVFPDCVKQESTGVLALHSDNLIWYMINAIKQLKAELDAAKAEIATLKGN